MMTMYDATCPAYMFCTLDYRLLLPLDGLCLNTRVPPVAALLEFLLPLACLLRLGGIVFRLISRIRGFPKAEEWPEERRPDFVKRI
jgi:hypothetical protein